MSIYTTAEQSATPGTLAAEPAVATFTRSMGRVLPIGRLKNIVDVIEFCIAWDFEAEVLGRWVWVEFPGKPSAEVRDALKVAGFRWAPKRQRWAHNCGYPCRHGIADPRTKYGSAPVGAFDDNDLRRLRSAV